MTELLLIPLEDSVVFPNMSVTLAVEVGDAERVCWCRCTRASTRGRHGRRGDRRVRLPGGAEAVTLNGLHRGVAGAARTGPDGRLYVEVDERPDVEPAARPDRRARARVPRGRRGDPRAARRRPADPRVRACDHRAPARSPTRLPTPRRGLRRQGRAARGGRHRRAARARRFGCSASGSPSCRCAGASARTWSPVRRSSSASTSCAARWSRSARSSARTTHPRPTTTARASPRPTCPTPFASRPSARCRGSSGWATSPASRR